MSLEAVYEPIDLTTAVFRLTGQISEFADHGIHKLILDLSGVEFLDSAGLGCSCSSTAT